VSISHRLDYIGDCPIRVFEIDPKSFWVNAHDAFISSPQCWTFFSIGKKMANGSRLDARDVFSDKNKEEVVSSPPLLENGWADFNA